jgi:hypothetical protein
MMNLTLPSNLSGHHCQTAQQNLKEKDQTTETKKKEEHEKREKRKKIKDQRKEEEKKRNKTLHFQESVGFKKFPT